MRVLVTGAGGFLGRQLVSRLLGRGTLRNQSIERLLLLDRHFEAIPGDRRLRLFPGSITDPALLRRVLADGVDVVFHLASVPGGAAEADYEQGRDVNLLASIELLEQLRNRQHPPVVVFASSVAVYGGKLVPLMDESVPPRPALSYGSHKRMIELMLEDLTRRGEIDARSLRLPGIVARPPQPNGLRSAFMSDLMHAFAEGRRYRCPVSPQATAWWMSAQCCVDNLLHAAELTPDTGRRVWQLPVLHLSIAQVVDALAEVFGDEYRALISFEPDPELETLFGRFPPLDTPAASALGFRHDGSARALIRQSFELMPALAS
ncbi:hypothetical protein GCM10011348_03760 [Marinobacterium nitratireducens]|uniref:NAD-dependent epimerase/dehydratase domain-containing protein n=1 Tax=Marinobacterium nitratireducens TaxID=518897 RepID=A0A918DQ06_9GAMM|nr:NAD-dependent epimerase/dehydratase family protein [Marinobacterium nitratireducens]GGO76471.1 hypothetical protein GCM10011348_03760 [Marinobacterium nitratireducens]